MYIVVSVQSGAVSITPMTKKELAPKLATKFWGDVTPQKALPADPNPSTWPEGTLVILKGEVVDPKPVTVYQI